MCRKTKEKGSGLSWIQSNKFSDHYWLEGGKNSCVANGKANAAGKRWIFSAEIVFFTFMAKIKQLEIYYYGGQQNMYSVNPLTPMTDEDWISPYNINTISSTLVMRVKKSINQGIISWSNTQFSELIL